MENISKEKRCTEIIAFIRPQSIKLLPFNQEQSKTFITNNNHSIDFRSKSTIKTVIMTNKRPKTAVKFAPRRKSIPGLSFYKKVDVIEHKGKINENKENKNFKENKDELPSVGIPIKKSTPWSNKFPIVPRGRRRTDTRSALRGSITYIVPMNYEIERQIGRGAYGVVKEVFNRKTFIKYAAKIYEKYRLFNTQKKNVNNEIRILRKLSHPNIVKLHDVINTSKQLMLILELIKGKSLYNYSKQRDNRRLEEDEVRDFMKQLLSAISYCHSCGVFHRDIKLENILIDRTQKQIKLIDFGFSTCAGINETLRFHCGTPSYMPPEMVNKEDYLGAPVDLWCIGIVMYTLICGVYPFKADTEKELYRKISNGVYGFPYGISSEARNLIEKFLQLDPSKRITAEEALKDTFFNIMNSQKTTEVIDGLYLKLNEKYGKFSIDKIKI